MKENKRKTDFRLSFSGEADEDQAYQEVLDYLINTGRYPDATQADNDATERVQFCEEIDLYANDDRLKNASAVHRKTHALIHSNKLYEVIAKNGGYLPATDKAEPVEPLPVAEEEEVLPALYPDPDFDADNDFFDMDIDHGPADDVPASAEPVIEPVIEPAVAEKESTFIRLIQYLTTATGLVALLLAAARFYIDSSDLLQITKYGFLLFIILLLASVAFAEVSGRLMTRLRYVSSYSLLVITATLSGLLFLQPPWTDATFSLGDGTPGMIANFITHRALAIGSFWLGVFFAVSAMILLIITWFARPDTNDD